MGPQEYRYLKESNYTKNLNNNEYSTYLNDNNSKDINNSISINDLMLQSNLGSYNGYLILSGGVVSNNDGNPHKQEVCTPL